MKRNVSKILLIAVIALGGLIFASCSLNTIVKESYLEGGDILEAPDLGIDEEELKSIEVQNSDLNETFDTDVMVISSDEIRDPFRPFYMNDEEEANILVLNNIYSVKSASDELVDYVELTFNDTVYNLKEEDVFQEVYQVQVINSDSVVLLVGDEYLTLYLNEMTMD